MLNDIRYAFRTLMANRSFAAVAIVTLAFGIGANTAIFSVVNAVLLEPLPYANANRLVAIWETRPNLAFDRIPTSAPDFEDWTKQTKSFDTLAAFEPLSLTLTGLGEPETLSVTAVSTNAFGLIGAPPLYGRTFREGDELGTDVRPVILSHTLWETRFNSDPNVIGTAMTLDDVAYTIIGVMPRDFDFPPSLVMGGRDLNFNTKVWTVIDLASRRNLRGNKSILVFGRLREGTSVAAAQQEMDAVARRLSTEYPLQNQGMGILVRPLLESVVRNARPSLLVLLGAVGLLLVIACANVANLVLARATTRRRELAIRAAMGASSRRLVRLLLTESILLSLAGGLAGLLLASWAIDFLVALAGNEIPRLRTLHFDAPVFFFTLAAAAGAGLLFGLLPALQARGTDLNQTLKNAGDRGSSKKGVKSTFIVAEVALATILLVGAGLLIQTFLRLERANLGFNARDLLAVQFTLPSSKYPEARRSAFYEAALTRFRANGLVVSTAVSTAIPLGDSLSATGFSIEGREPVVAGRLNPGTRINVSADYFRTMEIQIARGRDFTSADRVGSLPVAIINEETARRYFPGEDALGRRLKFGRPNVDSPWFTVVGISRDVRGFTVQDAIHPEIYVPYTFAPPTDAYIMIRSKGEVESTTKLARSVIAEIDPNQPVEIRTMDAIFARALAQPRLRMLLLTGFAVLALVMAAVGIYGVMSYFVNERVREIGVRIALGARKEIVLRMVLWHGLFLTITGIVIGLVCAGALSRFLSSLLFEVTGTDAATYGLVSLALGLLSVMAIYIPARRATRVDPMIALRQG